MSSNLVCMRHRDYDGTTQPELTCKVCCGKYVDHIIRRQKKMRDNARIEKKQTTSEFAPTGSVNFDPGLI